MSRTDEVIAYLQGSANSLDHAIELIFGEGEDLTTVDAEVLFDIDNAIFECASCNWWCEVSEGVDDNGETLCRDCARDAGIEEEKC